MLAVLSTLAPLQAFTEEYLPLWIGNRWEYRGVGGAAETKLVNRTTSVWGTQTFVIDYEASTSNEGLENYWTTEADGDVLLWGFWRSVEGFGGLYRPAIRVVDAPLHVGRSWSDSIAVYHLPDTLYVGTYRIAWRVFEAGLLAVPGGTFFAYGIGQTRNPMAGLGGYSLTGAALGPRADEEPTEWYSDGVGEIQYSTDDVYQLVFYIQPTAVDGTTWGRIKSCFLYVR